MTSTIRARDLGIRIGELPTGPHNAITDVPGVRVGHRSVILDDPTGLHTARTGVTVIEPRPRVWRDPVYAGSHTLNGAGELTGLHWVTESGMLTTPIALTNTHSVGVVRDALVARVARDFALEEFFYLLPVVGETYDGFLSDANGMHVTGADVDAAFDAITDGPVAEGNVGSGTGMICHEFKGGIGTSSRVVRGRSRDYTLGVLVQANHGQRRRLTIDGHPVGERIDSVTVPGLSLDAPAGTGSIIVVIATDAPLLPHQARRIAQRASLGIGRTGGYGEHTSGDLILAFSTAANGLPSVRLVPHEIDEVVVSGASDSLIDDLFPAVIDATEEAIVNALVAAHTMVGRFGLTARAIPHDLLRAAMESESA